MSRLLLLGMCLLLAACAARTPLPASVPTLSAPLPLALQIERERGDEQQSWWLVVQAEGAALRWSLFDPLGVPLARQSLENGAWRADGLLPPNDEARELFAALLFAVTPVDALAKGYAPSDWQALAGGQRWLAPDWRIRYLAPLDFTLHHAEGPRYRVHALADHETP